MTFSGNDKPLHFAEQRDRFSAYADKIRHVVVDDLGAGDAWSREYAQRNAILRGLSDLTIRDIAIISDIDEIPRKECVARMRASDALIFGFLMPISYFKFNYICVSGGPYSISTMAVRGLLYKMSTPQQIRNSRRSIQSYNRNDLPKHIDIYEHAGWHFSFIGDDDFVRKKIMSYAHQEYNHEEFLKSISIPDIIREGRDLFSRPGFRWTVVEMDDYFPEYIIKNRDRFDACIAKNPIAKIRR